MNIKLRVEKLERQTRSPYAHMTDEELIRHAGLMEVTDPDELAGWIALLRSTMRHEDALAILLGDP